MSISGSLYISPLHAHACNYVYAYTSVNEVEYEDMNACENEYAIKHMCVLVHI